MEEIYLKNHKSREWLSEEIHLDSYFNRFKDKISVIYNNGSSADEDKICPNTQILLKVSPHLHQTTLIQFSDVRRDTHGMNLTDFSLEDIAVKEVDEGVKNIMIKKAKESKIQGNIVEEKRRSKCDNRLKRKSTFRREINVDVGGNTGVRDLSPHYHYMVVFRIHEPYSRVAGECYRPGRCIQEIAVLGHQSLYALRDKILCEEDYQDIRGDISEDPDAVCEIRAKDKFKSGMFYLGNTFYVDLRDEGNLDYSVPIRAFTGERDIKVGPTLSMGTSVGDLKVRFGYPYLYMHQGNCEHVIIVSDARLLSINDNLISLQYPRLLKTSHENMTYCMLCHDRPVKYLVKNCDRLPRSNTLECKQCFKEYHYIDGNKIGKFEAYLHFPRSMIL